MSDGFQNDPLAAAQQTYSPLPQMVQRFRSMFGGGPAPRPPPDLEQQQQDTGRPDPSRMPEWNQPRRQNLALRPGAPTPPIPQFTPFTGAMLPRPHHQWGQEERFPQLPQSFEVPNILKGLSGYYAQNGGANLAQIAMMMGPYAGQFLEGVQQGRSEAAKTAKEQLALHAAKLKERAEEQLTAYSDITGEYHAIDPTMNKSIKGRGYMDALHGKAVEIGDIGPGSLGELIEAGAKPSDVVKFLEGRDQRLRDLQKTKQALDDDTVEETKWGLHPQPKAAADPFATYAGQSPSAAPGAAPAATAAVDPTTGAPAPTAPPTAKLPGDKVAGPGAPPDTAADQPHDPEDPFAPGSAGEAAVTDVMRGGDMNAQVAKRHPGLADAVYLEADRRNGKVQELIRNPPKDPAQIMDQVKKISPAMADDLDQVLQYKRPASGGTSGTGASIGTKGSQYGNKLADLAHLSDPKWNQGFYQDQQRFRTDVSTQTTLARTKDLAAMADRLNTDLRAVELDLKKRGMSTSDVNMDAIMRNLAGDPKYVPLHTDFLAYNDAYNTIVSGGRHTQGGAREQTNAIPTWAPLSTYRNVIKGHMSGVDGMIDAVRSRWRSIGGRDDNLPSGDDRPSADAFEAIKDYKLMDYVTGARPMKDVVVHNGKRLLWTGKNQIDRDARENWMAAD
ncbi:MAG TPA: hypothetical protein VHT52_01735 [Stellaceae bacterium]|jgi:hypothetical protein|nr:hypothetical protein [Stellaceae bacterium]